MRPQVVKGAPRTRGGDPSALAVRVNELACSPYAGVVRPKSPHNWDGRGVSTVSRPLVSCVDLDLNRPLQIFRSRCLPELAFH